jgi:hypothetical protein
MKKFLFCFIPFFFLFSCKEEGPYINFTPEYIDTSLFDTTYIADVSVTPDIKRTVLEDFTGVQCTNCPKAHAVIDQILDSEKDKVQVMAIHVTDDFGKPHGGSKEDYRIAQGTLIYDMLQGCGTLPRGAIDRTMFQGETEIIIDRSKWINYVNLQLAQNSPVNIDLHAACIGEGKVLIRVELHYTAPVSGKNYLSISITEDNIIDLQSKPGGIIDSFYQHNHVLRTMATPYNGRILMDNPELNRVFIKECKVKLEDHWKIPDIKVLAFVHKGAPDYIILNANQTEIQ